MGQTNVWNYPFSYITNINSKYMIHEQNTNAFCVEDISKIENYEQAISDKKQTWDCHHRAEILPCGRFSVDDLKKFNLYFHRPASELIFLTRGDHIKLHFTGCHRSDETKAKMSKTRKERIASGDIVVDTSACHTEEANKKISEKARERYSDKSNHPMYGRHLSDEAKKKISDANSGRMLTEEHKRNISIRVRAALSDPEVRMRMSEANKGERNGMFGKHHSESARRKQSEAHRGKPTWNKGKTMTEHQKAHLHRPKSDEHRKNIGLSRIGLSWFNDGKTNRLFHEGQEPAGFVKGRLPTKR